MSRNLYSIFLLFIIGFIYNPFLSFSQSVYVPLNANSQTLVERYEIKSGQWADAFHSHIKPFTRQSIANFADTMAQQNFFTSQADLFNLQYLQNDNWEWHQQADSLSSLRKPLLKYFFRQPSDVYHFRNEDFEVHVNPVLQFQVGKEKNAEDLNYINTRGIEVRGMISKKIGFYTFMADNQAVFPTYVNQRINFFNAVPHEGYYKNKPGEKQMDFLTARGYVTFNVVKNIALQFGHDRNFVGSGYRSMILSDYAPAYLFLKLNTKVWKLNYQNLFAQMNAETFNADGLRPKKYFAMHHLSMNVTKTLNIGVFESIVFGRQDSLQNGTFDFNYLNPIIFYRSVEQQLGSPDNAVLGLDIKWNFLKHFLVYGQLVIDELVISQIKSGKGWWGNKQAGQIGVKYIDVANISNLDLQVEVNMARPYTYTQNANINSGAQFRNYAHYNQPLAHPLGANFREFIGILRYQPLKRLNLTGKIIYAQYGEDANGSNWGGNILLDNKFFEQEFGNKIGQGIATKLLFGDFTASYQLFHNFFVDLQQIYRKVDSVLDERDQSAFITNLGIRWNIPQRLNEF